MRLVSEILLITNEFLKALELNPEEFYVGEIY